MKVSVEELKSVANLLIKELESRNIQEIDISDDYYWNIPSEYRYDPSYNLSQNDLTLGQLSENLEHLRKVLKEDTSPILYSFVWLSTIIRAIGENLVK